MNVDEFTKFVRDDIAATVNLAKDIHLVPDNQTQRAARARRASTI